MNEFRLHIFMFIIPGIIGNVMHMIVIKKDLLSFLAKPISAKLFGENKTFRGFVFLPLAIGIVCLISSLIYGPFSLNNLNDLIIGCGLGMAYMLAELPNSFIKRKLGIAAGESAGHHRFIQLIIDKSDSLLGACIFYFFVMNIDGRDIVQLFIISLFLHISISSILVLMKLKKSI